ncbi:MAG: hypothetical protein PHC70_05390 [Patescibacteria group bacterium]|nr:hypothetical protein [Patescibacteria group bacterium]
MFKATLKRCLISIGAFLALLPIGASAQQVNLPGLQLGMIGTANQTPVQISEARVTYRFDQGGTGKAAQAVPVQMTYRLHNPSATQTMEVYVPVAGQEGDAPEITAIFVNGKEQPLSAPANQKYYGLDQPIRSIAFSLTLPKDADAIVDVRALQPITGENIPFAFQTAKAWADKIPTGTLEAFFTFTTANWNVALRELKQEPTLVPITYSGKTAAWNFSNLDAKTSSDVFWQTANLEAMAYYEQGLDLWRQNNNDPQAYKTLKGALLDMIPCHGEQMPLATWWNSMLDTANVGILSALPPGDAQDTKAMEIFSNNWTMPQGEDKSCIAMQQRPDRYRSAFGYIMQVPQDQRSETDNQALEKHYAFLNKLTTVMGENSLGLDPNNIPSTDPFGNSKLSDKDKQLLAIWDYRFGGSRPSEQTSTSTGQTTTPTNIGSSVSSTLANLFQKLPKLSFRTQVVLFAILALIVLIIIGFIVFKWQETPTVPERKDNGPSPFGGPKPTPTVPLLGRGLGSRPDLTQPQSPISKEEKSKNEPENIFKPPAPPVPPPVPPIAPKPPTVPPAPPKPPTPLPVPPTPPTQQSGTNNVNNNEPKPPLSI